MHSLRALYDLGKELGYEGQPLAEFVKEEQERDRQLRQEERDIRKAEHAEEVLQLQLRREEQEWEIQRLQLLQASHEGINPPVLKIRGPTLQHFDESKDDMDSYLRRFEMFATTAKWTRDSWAIILSSCLQGSTLEVYGRLSEADATNYNKLKYALMDRFKCTEEGFRKRFRNSKPKRGEKVKQFVQRLQTNLSRWVELSTYNSDFEGLSELIIIEQFLQTCGKGLQI